MLSHCTWQRFGRWRRHWGHRSDVWHRRRGRWTLGSRCILWGSSCKTLDTTCIEFEETTNHVRIEERGKQDVERQRRCDLIGRALPYSNDLDDTLKDHP